MESSSSSPIAVEGNRANGLARVRGLPPAGEWPRAWTRSLRDVDPPGRVLRARSGVREKEPQDGSVAQNHGLGTWLEATNHAHGGIGYILQCGTATYHIVAQNKNE